MSGDNDLESWIQREQVVATRGLLANISPNGAARGAVVASPSRENPDYFKHWIRDAGLTMDVVVTLFERASSQSEKDYLRNLLMDFMEFSRRNQTTSNPSGGLGEPLFYADGSPYLLGWGRPQNDGPAIRAYALIRWANILLAEGKESLVRDKLYDSKLPTDSIIKADLEFVAHHLDESSFDLWEEVRGFHFYTRMVQRRALIDGANLADRLGDFHAASFYRYQAQQVSEKLNTHWHWTDRFIISTLGRDGGIDYKSGLDTSTLLAGLHGDIGDGFFPLHDDRYLATAAKLVETFRHIYPINHRGTGVALGRYPEDRYNGYSTGGEGNPWVLLTNALAEFYYRVARSLRSRGEIRFSDVNFPFYQTLLSGWGSGYGPGRVLKSGEADFEKLLSKLHDAGDDILRRTQYHTPEHGYLAEQMNRHTGFMQGADNLTWSEASMLTAIWAR